MILTISVTKEKVKGCKGKRRFDVCEF